YHRRFAELFHENGAVFAYSSYVSGIIGGWDRGFRYDLEDPLGSIADMLNLQVTANYAGEYFRAIDFAKRFVDEYSCDGTVWHGIKSCRLATAAVADFREHFQERFGIPALLLETDIVDPRYFAEAQLKNRIDAFIESLAQRKLYRA
ncbi:MAG TPA: 2-hydroxyacyl-CoA dehydratase family protein, partial [Dehalococcoidia bacterium]|nr:2-hydroxyacyl-CoA dehydratase family protein [Dehalococcoidia bacterium]